MIAFHITLHAFSWLSHSIYTPLHSMAQSPGPLHYSTQKKIIPPFDLDMIKLRGRRLFRSCSSKSAAGVNGGTGGGEKGGKIEWEVRPGGLLVQKRSGGKDEGSEVIQVRVSTGSKWHDISIGATSTFGELKVLVSLVTGLEPKEQRLLFKGKEREDRDHLHMVGVKDSDKVLMLEDPAIKERKLGALRNQVFTPCHVIKV